ncbi:MAG: hypothetical protein GYB64_00330 [Chloroflexi bacterium]|nr:hypothetical protein [Chloroflexota bacterium]
MNDKLDDLLREVPFGQESEGAHDEDDLLTLARQLRAADLSHRSEIRVDLRERLQQEKTMLQTRNLQRVAIAAALALTLGLLTLFGPGRSFATEIIGQLGIVSVSSDDPEYDEAGFDPTAPTATPINPEELNNAALDVTSEEGPYVKVSAAEVAAATGVDRVYEPQNVPYPFTGWKAFADGEMVHISSMWSTVSEDGLPVFVSITQMRSWPAFTYEAGRDAATETRVIGGHEALVITGADLELSDGRLFTLVIIEVGQDTLVVQSPSLDSETVVAIAESLFE